MIECPPKAVDAPTIGTKAVGAHSVAPITVCQLLHSLNVGGAEILASRLARRLRDQFRFVFICLDAIGSLGEELRRDGFDVVQVGRRPGLDWSCRRRLCRALDNLNVDIVHAHQYTPYFYANAARLFARRRPILFTEHGRHQPDYPRIKRKIANRLWLSRRDRIVGVGEAVRQALIQNEGFRQSRVEVLYNGIDVEFFSRGLDRDDARELLQADPHDYVILQVARFDYLKDHITAVQTLSEVLKQTPQALLVLVGDGPERAKIEAEATRLRVTNRIRFLGERDDVARLLCGADLFLLTSVSEGIPLTMLEAMAAGLPVVSTNVGGVSEVVVDGETGLLAAPKDVAALSASVLRIATDCETGRRMGKAGHTRARQHFDESRMSAEYERIYHELVGV